jgi:TetR/AcrR family transcriptional regulator, transcriptional repressor for nem operon
MVTRTTKGAETRLRIIRAAADLFHKQGVAATSPDQIIAASGTGKSQFYHYFGSKEGLVHEVLQAWLEAVRGGTYPADPAIDSWRDLEQWFRAHVKWQKRFQMTRGCPLGTIGNEVTTDDELVRQDLTLIFEVMRNKLAAFFIREKAAGRLAPGAREHELADFCLATVEGAMLMGRISRSSAMADATIDEALIHLRSYIPAP